MIKNTAVAVMLILGAAHANAINKCTGPDGKVTLTDKACPENLGTVGEDIQRKNQKKVDDDRLTAMAREHDRKNKLVAPVVDERRKFWDGVEAEQLANAEPCNDLARRAQARGATLFEQAALVVRAKESRKCKD